MKLILRGRTYLLSFFLSFCSFQIGIARDDGLAGNITPDDLPSVDEVIEIAVNSLPKSFSEQDEWIRRIRKSVFLPSVTLSYGTDETNYSRYERLSSSTGQLHNFPLDSRLRWDDDFRITLSWSLSGWVFSGTELLAVEKHGQIKRLEIDIIKRVIDGYFELKEAILALQEEDSGNRRRLQMQKEKSIAMLDSLTNSYVSEYLRLKVAER